MNAAWRVLEAFTRPWVVLALRVAWDIAAGFALLVGVLTYQAADLQVVGLVTIAAGAWSLIAARRAVAFEFRR